MKEIVLKIIQKLPNNVTDEEIADTFLLGYKQAEDGESISTEDLLKEIKACE